MFPFQPQPKRYHLPIWWVWPPSTLKAHLHRRESLARREPWIGNMFWGFNPAVLDASRNREGVTVTQTEPMDMKRRRRSVQYRHSKFLLVDL